MINRSVTLSACMLLSAAYSWCGQGASKQVAANEATPVTMATPEASGHLHLETTKIPSELAGSFPSPLKCDADENLYLRTGEDLRTAIRKLSPKGELLALFQPAAPDLKVDFGAYFSVGHDGDVYQLIYAHEISRYVFVYKSDGTFKSKIKLQPGFPWLPSTLAPFWSGDLLISGQTISKDPNAPLEPFTGIFAPDGTLRKEVALEDDEKLGDMLATHDTQVFTPQNPTNNRAISSGAAESAMDGNVYLMRRLSPALFYVISPGAVVRRFTVDPGKSGLTPTTMHIAGNRIAVLFRDSQTNNKVLKVVDLEGQKIASYEEPIVDGKKALGGAFVCYANNPERFMFLTTMEDERLGVIVATP